jgi:hypothetical protein
MHRPLLLLLLALTGCARRAAPLPDTTPEAIRVPEGCEAPLDGEWVHARDSSHRYSGVDDGTTLQLTMHRTHADGGLGLEEVDGGTPTIELERTPEGFRGAVLAQQFAGGRRCQVRYPTDVLSCADAGLTLSTVSVSLVDPETCQPEERTRPAVREVHQLVRPEALAAPTEDGGLPPDAGTP